MSKYGNKKVTVDNHTFDSLAEAKYYEQLKFLQYQNMIKKIELQPVFELQPKFEKNHKKYRAITYKADFLIIHNDGRKEIVDIKGIATEAFKIKAKMFEYHYPELTLTILSECPKKWGGGFIPYEELKRLRAKEKREKGKKN